tara:strand:- start:17432 stop:17869 length:438 start_codon:yes stop_codon:yes gene_type:complete
MKKSKRFESVVRLPPEDSGLQHSIVRLNNNHIDSKKHDTTKFFRRDAVVVINQDNGEKVLRYVMGNPGLSITKDSLAIDYDAVDHLGIKYKEQVNVEVRAASAIEVLMWFWHHPDLSVNLSVRLGVIGAVLGVLGFMTGLASMFA